jgi:hypothetical protein
MQQATGVKYKVADVTWDVSLVGHYSQGRIQASHMLLPELFAWVFGPVSH